MQKAKAYRLVGDAYMRGLMNGEVGSMGLDDEDMLLV